MHLTKEKLLALVALVVAAIVLMSARLPAVEEVPAVPPEEGPRAYRTVGAAPRLAPQRPFEQGLRDPFRRKDPWAEAPPALLAAPPAVTWPRALPGGLVDRPRGPEDRLLVRELPGPGKAAR